MLEHKSSERKRVAEDLSGQLEVNKSSGAAVDGD